MTTTITAPPEVPDRSEPPASPGEGPTGSTTTVHDVARTVAAVAMLGAPSSTSPSPSTSGRTDLARRVLPRRGLAATARGQGARLPVAAQRPGCWPAGRRRCRRRVAADPHRGPARRGHRAGGLPGLGARGGGRGARCRWPSDGWPTAPCAVRRQPSPACRPWPWSGSSPPWCRAWAAATAPAATTTATPPGATAARGGAMAADHHDGRRRPPTGPRSASPRSAATCPTTRSPASARPTWTTWPRRSRRGRTSCARCPTTA